MHRVAGLCAGGGCVGQLNTHTRRRIRTLIVTFNREGGSGDQRLERLFVLRHGAVHILADEFRVAQRLRYV